MAEDKVRTFKARECLENSFVSVSLRIYIYMYINIIYIYRYVYKWGLVSTTYFLECLAKT